MRPLRWLALAVVAFGCGPIVSGPPASDGGAVCYEDTDCAPNGCCGKGDAVVHVSMSPDCSAVKCDGSCPVNGIKCGCAIPVCRNNRCSSAIATTPGC